MYRYSYISKKFTNTILFKFNDIIIVLEILAVHIPLTLDAHNLS